MAKVITEHQVNECNSAIRIEADDPNPKHGNASHVYTLEWDGPPTDMLQQGERQKRCITLNFQDGPIGEVGVNGITHEALLAVLIDRLRGFQDSPFACSENAHALSKLEHALDWLHSRTKARVARGVEGSHQV